MLKRDTLRSTPAVRAKTDSSLKKTSYQAKRPLKGTPDYVTSYRKFLGNNDVLKDPGVNNA